MFSTESRMHLNYLSTIHPHLTFAYHETFSSTKSSLIEGLLRGSEQGWEHFGDVVFPHGFIQFLPMNTLCFFPLFGIVHIWYVKSMCHSVLVTAVCRLWNDSREIKLDFFQLIKHRCLSLNCLGSQWTSCYLC